MVRPLSLQCVASWFSRAGQPKLRRRLAVASAEQHYTMSPFYATVCNPCNPRVWSTMSPFYVRPLALDADGLHTAVASEAGCASAGACMYAPALPGLLLTSTEACIPTHPLPTEQLCVRHLCTRVIIKSKVSVQTCGQHNERHDEICHEQRAVFRGRLHLHLRGYAQVLSIRRFPCPSVGALNPATPVCGKFGRLT